MKNAKFYRISNGIGSGFNNFWIRFKTQILMFAILFFISFIIGIIVASKFGDALEFERMANQHFFRLISCEINIWSYFLINIIFFFIGFVFGFLFCSNLFVVILDFIFIFIIGYLLGFDTVVCLINFTFLSRIFFIIFYVLLNIILNILLCALLGIGLKRYLIIRKFGKYCPLNSNFSNYLFIISFLIITISLIQCITLSLIHFVFIL